MQNNTNYQFIFKRFRPLLHRSDQGTTKIKIITCLEPKKTTLPFFDLLIHKHDTDLEWK